MRPCGKVNAIAASRRVPVVRLYSSVSDSRPVANAKISSSGIDESPTRASLRVTPQPSAPIYNSALRALNACSKRPRIASPAVLLDQPEFSERLQDAILQLGSVVAARGGRAGGDRNLPGHIREIGESIPCRVQLACIGGE